ncbi:MAG TPA: hypothetical protein VF286_07305 [Acidiphilium sp.]
MGKSALAISFAALATTTLAGCATGPGLAVRMSTYVGRPESTLIAGLGVPDRKITADGVTWFAYVNQQFHYSPGTYGMGPFFSPWGFYGPPFGGLPPTAYTTSCTVTFAIKGGMVMSYTLRGNDCS